MNWIRRKVVSTARASVLTVSVFASPGTPSISTCPSASSPMTSRSTMARCPTMTRPHLAQQPLDEGALPVDGLLYRFDVVVHVRASDRTGAARGARPAMHPPRTPRAPSAEYAPECRLRSRILTQSHAAW